MNRRSFLSFIGLAPVAAAVPAMALPRPENVKETVKSTVDMDYALGSVELEKPLIFKDGNFQINLAHIKQITGGTIGNSTGTVKIDLDAGAFRFF